MTTTNMDVGVRLNADGTGFISTSRQAKQAQDQQTASTEKLTAATRRASSETGKLANFNTDLERNSRRASVVLAQQAQQQQKVTGTSRAMTAGLQQAGFQASDFFVQVGAGTSATRAFSLQAPQMIQALSLMGTGMNKTSGIFGRFFGLLAGPWGVALTVGVSLLGVFASALSKSSDAAEDAADAHLRHKDALDFQTLSLRELIKATREQERAAFDTLQTTYAQEQAALAAAEANLKQAESEAVKQRAAAAALRVQAQQVFGDGEGGDALRARADEIERQADLVRTTLERTVRLREAAVAAREVAAANDEAAAATLRFERAQTSLVESYRLGDITLDQYEAGIDRITKKRKAELEATREQAKAEKALASERSKSAALGSFISPVTAGVTSGFGRRRPPRFGASSFHGGLDFGVAVGTGVRAPQVGVVEAIGFSRGLGKYVVIDHGGGTKTRFGHLSDNSIVSEGSVVQQGQVFARSGNTGISTGPHLHYEVLVNGKRVDPSAGRFPFDPVKVAEVADKAGAKLGAFGERASDSILRINDRFGDQPKLITQAQAAIRDLDDIMADLAERQPPGFEQMINMAQEAKAVVVDSLQRPYREMVEDAQRNERIQRLILAGREDEAVALQDIYRLVDRVGFATEEQRNAILDNVAAERQLNDLLEQRQELISAYTSATRGVRGEIESLLAGETNGNFFKSIQRQFQRLQARVLTEQLFGPIFRELDEYVRQNTGIQTGVDIMKEGTEEAGAAAHDFADRLEEAAMRVDGMFNGQAGPVGGTSTQSILSPDFAAMIRSLPQEGFTSAEADIVVNGNRAIANGVMAMGPRQFFGRMFDDLLDPLMTRLDDLLGVNFFRGLSGILSSALTGYATAGPVGGVLGGAAELFDKVGLKGLSALAGTALGGAQTGFQIAQLGEAFGINTSSTGGAIGGAIGSVLPIPGGSIIGSLAGSLLGGIFGGTKRGSAIITSADGALGTYGNSRSRKESALGLGGSVQEGIQRIAEALGAQTGSFSVSIGIRKDDFRVDPQGRGYTKISKFPDIRDFGSDQAGAIAFAISDAIKDGAIVGVSQAVQNALRSSEDPDFALSEALAVQELESLLGGITGNAERAFMELAEQEAERLRLARSYGLSILEVEKLNAEERLRLREDLERQSFGSLQDLLQRMRSGDLFEGSAVDRRTALLADIETATERAKRGEEGAADELANLLEQLNEVSRDAFGTTGEFATDRANIIATAEGVISVLSAQLDAADASTRQENLLNENNDQNAQIIAALNNLPWSIGNILNGGVGTYVPPAGTIPAAVPTTGGSTAGTSGDPVAPVVSAGGRRDPVTTINVDLV